jgi:carboxymethylenebutenolidase
LRETQDDAAAVRFAHRILKALWEEERDTGDRDTLSALLTEADQDAEQVLRLGAEPRWAERREADTRSALARGVFGAPSYVIGDDIFWGQDRLEFVERRLSRMVA